MWKISKAEEWLQECKLAFYKIVYFMCKELSDLKKVDGRWVASVVSRRVAFQLLIDYYRSRGRKRIRRTSVRTLHRLTRQSCIWQAYHIIWICLFSNDRNPPVPVTWSLLCKPMHDLDYAAQFYALQAR